MKSNLHEIKPDAVDVPEALSQKDTECRMPSLLVPMTSALRLLFLVHLLAVDVSNGFHLLLNVVIFVNAHGHELLKDHR